jgi:transposase-like protein
MARQRTKQSAPCPHCGGTSVWGNGSTRNHRRWKCGDCGKTFGTTLGTPMYRLRTKPDKIARALLVVMRRGSLRAAEEITGHKYETIRGWLLAAGSHAEALTTALVKELELDEVEVDAFWSFVGNAVAALQRGQARYRRWAVPPCVGQRSRRGTRSGASGGGA